MRREHDEPADDLDAVVNRFGDPAQRVLLLDLAGPIGEVLEEDAQATSVAAGLRGLAESPAVVVLTTSRDASRLPHELAGRPLARHDGGPGPDNEVLVDAADVGSADALRDLLARYRGRAPVLVSAADLPTDVFDVLENLGGGGVAVGTYPPPARARWWLSDPGRVPLLLQRLSGRDERRAEARAPEQGPPAEHPIESYGLIGDSRTCALVSPDGSIDWMCLPRFDSPSVFAALLDPLRGGRMRIRPHERGHLNVQRTYLGETNVLVNRFVSGGDPVLTLTDFLVYSRVNAFDPTNTAHTLVRRVEAFADVEAEVEFQPRFDYGRAHTTIEAFRGGVRGAAGSVHVELLADDVDWRIRPHEDGQGDVARAIVPLRAGEERWFLLRPSGAEHGPHAHLSPPELLDLTIRTWGRWSRSIDFAGPWRDAVVRSALVLKALVYEPTGALVAAPTTSLPEAVGEERNWDYRFSWIRDSAYVLECFLRIGHAREADTFIRWLSELTDRIGGAHELRPLYRITGEEDLSEFELPHLSGYRGSRPVRVGNGAASQLQLDIYGAVMQLSYLSEQLGGEVPSARWPVIRELVDTVEERWRDPDSGLWEIRAEPRHHTFSRFMCWLAVDRAIRIGEGLGLRGPYDRWRALADEIAADLLANGYDEDVGAFTQAYGSPHLDAAVLLLPLRGFVAPSDPRVARTVEAIRRELEVADGLLLRYRSEDGLGGEEGAFLLCSFWLVELLARMGELDEAERLFERLLGLAGPLGLYGEEIDPVTQHHLGNYPQGFTHMGLIAAATALVDERENHRAGGG